MVWIYLSPHLDDAALSCGGLIWQQVQAGEQVQVWTVCAGEAPPGPLSVFAQVLHKRWGFNKERAVVERRREDIQAMHLLGAEIQHLAIPDAVYRRNPQTNEVIYNTWEDILNGLAPGEEYLVERLAIDLARMQPAQAKLVAPLTLGNHVDHLLTRVAAEQLRLPLRYYLDFPYAKEYDEVVSTLLPEGYQRTVYPVSEPALSAWQDSVAAYKTQISTFWSDEEDMRADIANFCSEFGGIALFEPKAIIEAKKP